MTKKTVQFKAIKTVKTPVTVKFRTKTGETVSFKAVKTKKKSVTVKFKTRKR